MTTSDTLTMLGWCRLSRMLISRMDVTGKPSRSFSILICVRMCAEGADGLSAGGQRHTRRRMRVLEEKADAGAAKAKTHDPSRSVQRGRNQAYGTPSNQSVTSEFTGHATVKRCRVEPRNPGGSWPFAPSPAQPSKECTHPRRG
jgi:hypothetical protein